MIDKFLNISQIEICKWTEILVGNETPSIVSGTAGYDLPSDWLKTVYVQYRAGSAEFVLLIPMSSATYLRFRTITTSSRPTHYSVFDGKVYIYPTPTGSSDTYYHQYIKLPQELVDLTDVPYNAEERFSAYHQEIADLAINLIQARENKMTSFQVIAAFTKTRLPDMKKRLGSTIKPLSGQARRSNPLMRSSVKSPRLPSNY